MDLYYEKRHFPQNYACQLRTPYHRREEDHQSNCRSNHQYSVGTQTAEVLINGLSPDQSGGNPTWARCCRVVTVPIMFFIMHVTGKEAYVIAVDVNLCHEFLNSGSTFVIIGNLYKNPTKKYNKKECRVQLWMGTPRRLRSGKSGSLSWYSRSMAIRSGSTKTMNVVPVIHAAFPTGFFAMNSPCFFTMLPSTLASTPASMLNRFLPSVSGPIKINKSRVGFYASALDSGWKMTYTVDSEKIIETLEVHYITGKQHR